MDAPQRAVPVPALKVFVQRAARRQVTRDRAPLAARAENVEQALQYSAFIDRAFVPAALRGRDQRRNQRPLRIGQVARIAQLAAIVVRAVLGSPHRGLLRIGGSQSESQMTQGIQHLRRRTLRASSQLLNAFAEPIQRDYTQTLGVPTQETDDATPDVAWISRQLALIAILGTLVLETPDPI